MKSIITPKFIFLFIIEILWRLVAWAIIPFMLRSAKRDTSGIVPYGTHPEIPRYTLPKWCQWAQCQDDVLPPCMYEPSVYIDYLNDGWKTSSWQNLSFRNVGSGIMWKIGRPAKNYMSQMTDDEKWVCGVYENEYKFGPLKLIVGYAVYRDWYSRNTNDGFWAVPRVTLRINK